jgi:hypothetical protein
MTTNRAKRILSAAGVSAVLFGIWAAPASASFHLNRISQVHTGTGGGGDYIELQSFTSGQNFVSGHWLATYSSSGSPVGEYMFPSNVPNGGSQRTILVSDGSPVGVTPDFNAGGSLNVLTDAGSACLLDTYPPVGANGIDCVSWGAASPPMGNPSPIGTPVPGGLLAGETLVRSISAGCGTLFESGDDTNDSAADFALGTSNPRNNAATPTEHACPPPPTPKTTIIGGPKGRTRDRTPTFRFEASLAGSAFRCRIDSKPFKPCSSPKTFGKLGFGPHTFQVKARKGGRADPTPAGRSFKVVRPG